MKKIIGVVTVFIIIIMATMQGTEFGQEVNNMFSNVWSYIGVATGGLGGIAVYSVYVYIKNKLGVDIVTEFSNLLKNSPEQAKEILTNIFGNEKTKELLVTKDEYIDDQTNQLRQKILENRDKVLNLDIKINTKGLLSDEQLRTAIALQADIKEWLNENDTKSI